MIRKFRYILICISVIFAFAVSACSDEDAKKIGKKGDELLYDAKKKIDDAKKVGKKMEKAFDDAKKKIEDSTEK